MKLTAAIAAAGAALSLTTALVGAARLRQDARHQAERNEALLAHNQLDWLSRVSTNADLAELWKPEDMKAEEYMQLMSANRLICALSLRHCLGRIRDGQLPFYAAMVMDFEVCRRYWKRFGDLRAQEAEGDEQAQHFTRALDEAAKNHPQAQPAPA
ncbi:peptide transporter permease SapC [Streptomyces coelicoflavus]|uniref:Peptide transporter permease SapC n=1 Tax=Streptomyces coelicoflavus TaxID=285562 RepID=A0A7K3PQZ6_9ACTN|nr:DUF6082 family protein [Streptomyces coelicoflavus]NEB12267.1 peptide transporter permease SapC [Streptomyces coelicoflavus]